MSTPFIPIVVDAVVVSGLVVAFNAGDSSACHISDGIADVLNMVSLLAEEAIGGEFLPSSVSPLNSRKLGPFGKLEPYMWNMAWPLEPAQVILTGCRHRRCR